MTIAAEALTRSYRSFTSSDSTGTDYDIISGDSTESKAITHGWIVNADTVTHTVTVSLQAYNGSAWVVVLSKAYTVTAGESAALPEFIGPLLYRPGGNHDKITAKITESVSASKSVYVSFAGAAFS